MEHASTEMVNAATATKRAHLARLLLGLVIAWLQAAAALSVLT